MIVRILGEGQRTVDDGELETLNALDNDLIAACDAGDPDKFAREIRHLLARTPSELEHRRSVGLADARDRDRIEAAFPPKGTGTL